ncbi:hypothetical protein [Haloarcula halophila]|uniref:hypothetical protein n=1 Tax=Haloarcula TaxID=2237 RepID=UPI0023E3DC35|nr:hypothetical protein [Halomicroarcula sp. DFY41]
MTPAKTRSHGCGTTLGPIDPVLLDYGRDDGLLLACRLCEDCREIVPTHTASNPDRRERCGVAYPYTTLRLYECSRGRDDAYPQWDLVSLDLDGERRER